METACVPHTEIPGTSRLFADYLYHFDRLAGFFSANPDDPESYPAAAARIEYPADRRKAMVEALREINGDNPRLDLLAQPETVAVVTGQQVGLFSGPCYSIYKALTAAKAARELTGRGIPAVPIFWLATEDHDAEEVSHCRSLDGTGRPAYYRVDVGESNDRLVGPMVPRNPPLAELRSSFGDLPYGDEIAGLVEASYAPGRTFGAAFQDLMRRLLSEYGLIFLDPLHPGIRRLAAPFLADAHERSADLGEALLDRNRELEAAGYHSQVKVDANSSLFFLLDDGRRVPLKKGEAASAEQLSPNALLRPLMQDFLLPTLACVGGPAEIAYLAQSRVLYDNLLGRMPVVIARRGFTVLGTRSAKLFDRYGLTLSSFFTGTGRLRDEIAGKLVPAGLQASLRETRDRVSGITAELHGSLYSFDPTLAAALDTSQSKILYQLRKIETKTSREALRRNERASADADYLTHLIYPDKHLQERYYTILPFLARHGLDLIHQLYENVHLDCPDHIVLTV